ncbi:unnamed protein product, partial [Mesorhabditis belari]|uniref:Uncharacterized protein n=1 Tax=Mesorhabditis belari TaxID=2138241 RepID=A0AAF3EFQ2_9BILA
MDNGVYASPLSIMYRTPHFQQHTVNLPIWNPIQPLTVTLPTNEVVPQEVRFVSPVIEHNDSVTISESETSNDSPKNLENNKTVQLPTILEQANQREKDVYRNYQKVGPQVTKDHPGRHRKTVAFGRTTNVSQTVEAPNDIAAFQRGFQLVRQPQTATTMEMHQPAAEKTQENKENAPQTKVTLQTNARMHGTSSTKNITDWRPSFEANQREITGLKKEVASLKEEMEELKKKNAQQNEMIVKLQGQVIDLLTDKKRANLNLSSVSVQETISAHHDTSHNRTACQEGRGAPAKNRGTNKIMAGEQRNFSPKLEQILSSDAGIVESLWANDNPESMFVSIQRTPIHSVFDLPPRPDKKRNSVTTSPRYTVEHPAEEEFEELEDDYEETRPRNQKNYYDRNDREDRQGRIEEIRQRLSKRQNEKQMATQEDEFGEF